MTSSRNSIRAFTLIELLVVVTIIGLLSALSLPALNHIKRSSDLTTSLTRVSDQLEIARQKARALNQNIEVRFYLDSNGQGTGVAIYGQLPGGTSSTPVQKTLELPATTIVNGNTTYTTLFSTGNISTDSRGRKYRSFEFLPDGSANLTDTSNAITLVLAADLASTSTGLPSNFASIVIDPVTGRLRYFRP